MKTRFFWRRFNEREIYLILQGLDHVQEEYEDEILTLINAIRVKDPCKEGELKEPLRDQIALFKQNISRLKTKVLYQKKTMTHGT